jgi:NADH:ubiquinone oxidoreductase subunit E
MEQGRGHTQYPGESSKGEEGWFEVLRGYEGKPENLIPMLQRTQRAWGFLPEWALLEISGYIGLPPAKVFGVATFYAQFRLQPIGRHIIRVCRGTACHVRGSNRILKQIQSRLHVTAGETTRDRLFTLETVACFGSCALAPVMVLDDRVYGRMNSSKAMAILDEFREAGKQALPSEHRALGLGR